MLTILTQHHSPRHLSRQHLSWGHLSISAISQLLLARFGSNFKQRVLGTYIIDYNCYHDICLGNICLGDICPFQQYKYFQAEHFRLQSCCFLFFKESGWLIYLLLTVVLSPYLLFNQVISLAEQCHTLFLGAGAPLGLARLIN